jgi:hypothetical protein
MEVASQCYASAAFTSGNIAGTRLTGARMVLGADLHRYGKLRPPPGFDPRTAHTVASRYTDYVIPVHDTKYIKTNYCEGYRSDTSIPFFLVS